MRDQMCARLGYDNKSFLGQLYLKTHCAYDTCAHDNLAGRPCMCHTPLSMETA